MRPAGLSTVLILGGMTLAACAPKPPGASDMPRPRFGLWTWVGAAAHGDVCSSGQPVHIPDTSSGCSSVAYSKVDGGVEIDSVCGDDAVKSQVRMRFSGDFQSAYSVDTHSDLSVPGKPPVVSDLHAAFSYSGPCPPGRAADDLQ
jgi:hypothetical protein